MFDRCLYNNLYVGSTCPESHPFAFDYYDEGDSCCNTILANDNNCDEDYIVCDEGPGCVDHEVASV